MKYALYVTTKGFCKRAWMGALLAVGALVLGPLLFLIITRMQGLNFNYIEHDLFAYHFAYLGFSWIVFLAVCLHALTGCQKISLGLPVSSRVIATWMMLATVGLVVALQLVTNGAYRLLFFDERWLADYWPLLGPLLFITTLIIVGHYIFWSMYAPSFTRLLCGIAAIGALFWWFIARYYPNGYAKAVVPWSHVTLGEFVTLQLICVAAWYGGTRAFARVRAGTAMPSSQWQQVQTWWIGLVSGSIPERMLVPLSRRMALARLHWRESCQRAVIVGGTLFGIAVLAINLLTTVQFDMRTPRLVSESEELVEGFLMVTSLFSLMAAVIIAVLIGEGTCGPGRTEMKRFLAMAPLSDQKLNATLFWNMVKTFCFTLLLIQLGLVLSFVGLLLKGPDVFVSGLASGDWVSMTITYTVFLTLGAWTLTANMVSVFWTGRTWFYYTVLGIICGGIIFVFGFESFQHRFFGYGIMSWLFEMGLTLILPLLLLGGTLLAYVFAWRTNLIKESTAVIVFLFWLIGLIIWLMYSFRPESSLQTQLTLLWFYSSVLALAVMPLATIPLALSWNRHR